MGLDGSASRLGAGAGREPVADDHGRDVLRARYLETQGDAERAVRSATRAAAHDLEEALRIGTRIAIIDGDKVVQIGTPQEITSTPADDYARAFFEGIDTSRYLTAGVLMQADVVPLMKHGGCHAVKNGPTLFARSAYSTQKNWSCERRLTCKRRHCQERRMLGSSIVTFMEISDEQKDLLTWQIYRNR